MARDNVGCVRVGKRGGWYVVGFSVGTQGPFESKAEADRERERLARWYNSKGNGYRDRQHKLFDFKDSDLPGQELLF